MRERQPGESFGTFEERLHRHLEAALRDAMEVPEDAVTVMASLDGVLAPMNDGDAVGKKAATAARGQIAKGPAGYKEVGCATLSFCDEESNALAVMRMARVPERHKVTLKQALRAELDRRASEAAGPTTAQGRRRRERQLDLPGCGSRKSGAWFPENLAT